MPDNKRPTTELPALLYDAFIALATRDECEQFLDDLFSPKELERILIRWSLFHLLDKRFTQREIAKALKVSVATVSRVNKTRKYGAGGYKSVIDKLQQVRQVV